MVDIVQVNRSSGWNQADRMRNAALEAIGDALKPGRATVRALRALESIARSLEALSTPPQEFIATPETMVQRPHRLGLPDRERLTDAIRSVYDRHDHTQPLNHVNVVEWVDAVMEVLPR